MNRRDIIIISALINAGLLIVLFVSAIKTPEASRDLAATAATQSAPPQQEISLPGVPTRSSAADEVDRMLSQLAAQNTLSKESAPQHTAPLSWEKEAKELTIEEPTAFTPIATNALSTETPQMKTGTEERPFFAPLPSSAPKEATPSTDSSYATVTIKKGDNLDKIARAHHTTVSEIMQLNTLTSTHLRIGRVLKMPRHVKKTNPSSKTTSKPDASGPKYYVVRNGDNPWTIASKNKIKLSELLRLNQLDEESARQLKPGDQLRIR